MAAIEALILIVAGIVLMSGAVLGVVIRGIHQEERAWTLGEAAPTATARFTRRLLGACYPGSHIDWALSLDPALQEGRQLAGTDA
jgi:hypothetical protein